MAGFNKFKARLLEKAQNHQARSVTYVAFGDSITHGGMESGVHEHVRIYHQFFKELVVGRYPQTLLNVINSGIGGDNAISALPRLERDVIMYKPDFVTIMLGTNDTHKGEEGIEDFKAAIQEMIKGIREHTDAEILLITPPMLAKADNPFVPDEYREMMNGFFAVELRGYTQLYVSALHQVAQEEDVAILDLYVMWQRMEQAGVDINQRFSNGLNHPDREFHQQQAIAMDQLIFE